MRAYLRLIAYLKPYWGVITVTWVASLLMLGIQGLSIWIGAGFIEKILMGGSINQTIPESVGLTSFFDRTAAEILERSSPYDSLVGAVAILMACVLSIALLRFFKQVVFAVVNQNILYRIRQEMFEHLIKLDLSFSNRNRPGEISSIFIHDTSRLNISLVDAADRIFMQPLKLLFALSLMFSLSWCLTSWIVPFLITCGLIIHYAGIKTQSLAKTTAEQVATLQGNLTEYISTVTIARAFNREKHEQQRFDKLSADFRKHNIILMLTGSTTPQIVQLIFLFAGGILLLIGGNEVLIHKSMSGSTLVKMTFLLPMAGYSMQSLASIYVSIRNSIASAERVFRLIDETNTDFDLPGAAPAPPMKSGIVMDCVGYGVDGTDILSNISCTIPKGSIAVVFGKSGSGKTTLLRLLARFARCTKGAIRVDGTDITQFQGESWRMNLGIVSQEPCLLNCTLRENLLYARPDADDEQLKAALRMVLMWDETCVLPQGLETPVGNNGSMLSGGERQRITIARALLNEPDVLLLDEPTSMLDNKNRVSIIETIKQISQERTVIISTHDSRLRKIADIEILLERS